MFTLIPETSDSIPHFVIGINTTSECNKQQYEDKDDKKNINNHMPSPRIALCTPLEIQII